MRGLIELKKLRVLSHRMSDPAAMFRCEKCQTMGRMHKIHDGKARIGRITAEEYRGACSAIFEGG